MGLYFSRKQKLYGYKMEVDMVYLALLFVLLITFLDLLLVSKYFKYLNDFIVINSLSPKHICIFLILELALIFIAAVKTFQLIKDTRNYYK